VGDVRDETAAARDLAAEQRDEAARERDAQSDRGVEAIAGSRRAVGCCACAILGGALSIGSSTLAMMLGAQKNVLPARSS
jgi:hypothetical protein